ncbi:GNAT family N-acetyltransferase [Rubrobacter indicoceani]|uniref:GNAT family N-acetyltransferase n=1 Tax=Rubrobacter indicoceani TaxID=2051957 RepID=UPI000E5ABA22|nr:GNAT family N-acetyltransferase [Rubrobacter indicoceani]
MKGASGILGKLRSKVEAEGPGSVANLALQRVRDEVSLDETHVWYELEVDQDFPTREMPEGAKLVRATEAQTGLLADLDTVSPEGARERIRNGNELWITLIGEELSLACWIFPDSTPVLAAPGGWMRLPDGIVCLEDSIASPRVRGRGIGPATWSELGLIMRERGLRSIITKIRDDNAASRKAVAKCGFREIATTRYARKGLTRYASAKHSEGRAAEWISSQLIP